MGGRRPKAAAPPHFVARPKAAIFFIYGVWVGWGMGGVGGVCRDGGVGYDIHSGTDTQSGADTHGKAGGSGAPRASL